MMNRPIDRIRRHCCLAVLGTLFATTASAANPPTELESIRQAISAREAAWEAASNPIAALPAEVRRGLLGALPEEPLERLPLNADIDSPPDSLDWTNIDGQNFLTPIKDQGRCGSCVAFAVTAALEAALNISDGDPQWNPDLSEQHLFSCGGGLCLRGWHVSSALSYLRDYGQPAEACNDYISGRRGDRECSRSCPNWEDTAVRIEDWSFVANDVEIIKSYLIEGPLVTTMDVYEDFYSYASGVYSHAWGQREGRHCVTLVGWNDAARCWIVRNSWGIQWGQAGYFRIAWDNCGIGIQTARMTHYPTLRVFADQESYAVGDTGFVGIAVANIGNDFWGRIKIWAQSEAGERQYLFSDVRRIPAAAQYRNDQAQGFVVPAIPPGAYRFFCSMRGQGFAAATHTFSVDEFEIREQ